MPQTKYMVVEKAGYVGENDAFEFGTLSEALAHVRGYYDEDERNPEHVNCLHVGIRADFADGSCEFVA